jgi:hypothetical protein
MRLHRNKYTLRPPILPTVEKEKREKARGDKDGERPKGGPRD